MDEVNEAARNAITTALTEIIATAEEFEPADGIAHAVELREHLEQG